MASKRDWSTFQLDFDEPQTLSQGIPQAHRFNVPPLQSDQALDDLGFAGVSSSAQTGAWDTRTDEVWFGSVSLVSQTERGAVLIDIH